MRCIIARPCHLTEICRIMDDAKARLAALGLDQWQKGYPNRDMWEEDIRRQRAILAVDENERVVGAFAYLTDPEPSYDVIEGSWLTGGAGYASVHRFCVAGDRLGQGIAGDMMREAFRKAKEDGLPSVRIDTHPGNVPMQHAIQKAGFTYCGVIHLVGGSEDGDPRLAYEKLVSCHG